MAIRVWAHLWLGPEAKAHVRSDSTAALGALQKLTRPTVNMNKLAAELSLGLAHSMYGVKVVTWGHVGGTINDTADALSRLDAPEPAAMPEGLTSTTRHTEEVRNAA